jgi:hypothetical protein
MKISTFANARHLAEEVLAALGEREADFVAAQEAGFRVEGRLRNIRLFRGRVEDLLHDLYDASPKPKRYKKAPRPTLEEMDMPSAKWGNA